MNQKPTATWEEEFESEFDIKFKAIYHEMIAERDIKVKNYIKQNFVSKDDVRKLIKDKSFRDESWNNSVEVVDIEDLLSQNNSSKELDTDNQLDR